MSHHHIRPTVAISGAAAGIGRAMALRFAKAGYRVGAFDIDEKALAALALEASPSWELETARLDVTDAANWKTVLAGFVDDRLDILINNAGVLASGEFADIPVDVQRRMIDINVTGVMLGCHNAFEYLKATPKAQLVNLCSASAIYGQPELATYSATKGAVRGLTEALDLEWGKHDIRVIALWPLFVKTNMTADMNIGSSHTMGIHLTPDDVAEAAFAATHPGRQLIPTIHYGVGLPAKVLSAAADLAPTWATRLVNKLITRS